MADRQSGGLNIEGSRESMHLPVSHHSYSDSPKLALSSYIPCLPAAICEGLVLCIVDPQLWDDRFNIFYVIGVCCVFC